MNKFDDIEKIMNMYSKTIKNEDGSYKTPYKAFRIIAEEWENIKLCEKEKIIDILFE